MWWIFLYVLNLECAGILVGKGAQIVHVILVYRASFLDGPLSTYQQEVRCLAQLSCNECPWTAIIGYLAKEIQQWQEEGEV